MKNNHKTHIPYRKIMKNWLINAYTQMPHLIYTNTLSSQMHLVSFNSPIKWKWNKQPRTLACHQNNQIYHRDDKWRWPNVFYIIIIFFSSLYAEIMWDKENTHKNKSVILFHNCIWWLWNWCVCVCFSFVSF